MSTCSQMAQSIIDSWFTKADESVTGIFNYITGKDSSEKHLADCVKQAHFSEYFLQTIRRELRDNAEDLELGTKINKSLRKLASALEMLERYRVISLQQKLNAEILELLRDVPDFDTLEVEFRKKRAGIDARMQVVDRLSRKQ